MSKLFYFIVLAVFIFTPFLVVNAIEIENPLKHESFEELLNAIIDFIFYLAIVIAPIMITVAGFYFITAAGEVEKIERAKKIILWVMIGLLVVFCAKGLVSLFQRVVGGEEAFLNLIV